MAEHRDRPRRDRDRSDDTAAAESASGLESERRGFRPDVAGLRGVAILAVVAFHAGLPPSGGFLGVDLFFVISGFVIGRLLVDELGRHGRVSLGAFYARRARRILPALGLTTTVSMIGVALVGNPFGAQQEMANTALAGQTFVANVQLYRHTGYLDGWVPGTQTNPFLHLWSLSVEEQFYVALPLALWAAWGLARRTTRPRAVLFGLAAFATASSFGLAWALSSGRWAAGAVVPERLAFFGAPTRAWELGCGVLVALAERRAHRWSVVARGAAAGVGVAAVVATLVVADRWVEHPSWPVAILVVGVSALIAAGPATSSARLVGAAPFRWFGRVSYAWYLWHWPALVIATLAWPGHVGVRAVALVASLLVAWGSTVLVEEPIRRAHWWSAARTAAFGVTVVVLTVTVIGVARVGMRDRWGMAPIPDVVPAPVGSEACHTVNQGAANDTWGPADCITGPSGARRLVALVGDGSALGLAELTRDLASSRDARLLWRSRVGCPYAAAAPIGDDRCRDWQVETRRLLVSQRPDVVIIANHAPDFVASPTRFAPLDRGDPEGAWASGLRAAVRELAAGGTRVIVMGPAPDDGRGFVDWSPSRPDPPPPAPELAAVRRRASGAKRAQADAIRGTDAVPVDPVESLCTTRCAGAGSDGQWWYWAPGRLSAAGARLLGPVLGSALDRQLG